MAWRLRTGVLATALGFVLAAPPFASAQLGVGIKATSVGTHGRAGQFPPSQGGPYMLFAAARYRGGGLVDDAQINGVTPLVTAR